jgi:MraZ protein
MFRGTYEHPIDDKGRLNVPMRFRELLRADEAERLVITNFVIEKRHCLQAFPYDAWLQFEARLKAKPQFDPKLTTFKHFYLGGAHECQIDKQGRILIPPRLREDAHLKSVAVIVGDLDKFSIWDRETYSPVFTAGEEMLMNDQSFLSEI